MGKTVVLDGDCRLIVPQDGESGIFTAIRKPYPSYGGITVVTPTTEQQTLHTALQTLTTDIVIEPIPHNYGLVTWNGAFLMIS